MRENLSWILTTMAAVGIIVVGFEGSLGLIIGCIFTPTYIVVG